jgi:hypothetical protein
MLTDTRILTRHRAHEVLWQRQAIIFGDQSVVQLHQVRKRGVDEQYLRALHFDNLHWCVFDVRATVRSLARDIPLTPRLDVPGMLLYTFREQFPSATALEVKALANYVDVWIDGADGEPVLPSVPMPPRVTFQPELRAGA